MRCSSSASPRARSRRKFTHNTKAEIIWTVLPIMILVVMAWPATAKLIAMYDTRDSEMTVKVTGYQWMWKYEYLGEDVEFTSRLDARIGRAAPERHAVPTVAANPHYLLDVDNPLVLPVDTKIRFVITADDVIHAWWVPALGWKQDAIPGIINEAWTDIQTPGIYRGQCAELCGKDHGFMPIVVRAVPKEEFEQWLAAKRPAAPAPAGRGRACRKSSRSPCRPKPRRPRTRTGAGRRRRTDAVSHAPIRIASPHPIFRGNTPWPIPHVAPPS